MRRYLARVENLLIDSASWHDIQREMYWECTTLRGVKRILLLQRGCYYRYADVKDMNNSAGQYSCMELPDTMSKKGWNFNARGAIRERIDTLQEQEAIDLMNDNNLMPHFLNKDSWCSAKKQPMPFCPHVDHVERSCRHELCHLAMNAYCKHGDPGSRPDFMDFVTTTKVVLMKHSQAAELQQIRLKLKQSVAQYKFLQSTQGTNHPQGNETINLIRAIINEQLKRYERLLRAEKFDIKPDGVLWE
jgi:hypothetical protein